MNLSRLRMIIAGLPLVFFLAGCYESNVNFQAETRVQPDGSLTRTIQLQGESQDATETRYALPAGEWLPGYAPEGDLKKRQASMVPQFYKATAAYKPGQTISDYTYRGESPGHESRNEIHLKIYNLWFVKFFNYEEKFKNCTSREKAMAAAQGWFHEEADQIAKRLAEISGGKISPAEAKKKVIPRFNPTFDKIMQGYFREGPPFFDSKNSDKDIDSAFSNEKTAAAILEFYPAPAGEDSKVWKEKITQAVNDANVAVGNSISPGFEEDLFGIFKPFESHDTFNLSLSLPGHILHTNATTREGSKLVWEFDSNTILFDPYVLRANSRLIYPKRIALAGGIFLILSVLYLSAKSFSTDKTP